MEHHVSERIAVGLRKFGHGLVEGEARFILVFQLRRVDETLPQQVRDKWLLQLLEERFEAATDDVNVANV